MISAFINAFNVRDLACLKALLAPGATAQVLGAPFPVEQGPDDIAAKSLTHMLGSGDDVLVAESFRVESQTWVLFLAANGTLDSAATLTIEAGQVTRIEYYVTHFALAKVKKLAKARGVVVRTD